MNKNEQRRNRRIDRRRLQSPIVKNVNKFMSDGDDALIQFVRQPETASRIRNYIESKYPGKYITQQAVDRIDKQNSLTEQDKQFFFNVFNDFVFYAGATAFALETLFPTHVNIFNQVGKFALSQIGFQDVDFDLSDRSLLGQVEGVSRDFNLSAQNKYFQSVTIAGRQFIIQGSGSYDEKFFKHLIRTLNIDSEIRADRYGASASGSLEGLANQSTFQNNFVLGKKWNSTLFNNPDSRHEHLNGVVVDIDKTFNVNGEPGRFPHDGALSPGQRMNCLCWLTPNDDGADNVLWTGGQI